MHYIYMYAYHGDGYECVIITVVCTNVHYHSDEIHITIHLSFDSNGCTFTADFFLLYLSLSA